MGILIKKEYWITIFLSSLVIFFDTVSILPSSADVCALVLPIPKGGKNILNNNYQHSLICASKARILLGLHLNIDAVSHRSPRVWPFEDLSVMMGAIAQAENKQDK